MTVLVFNQRMFIENEGAMIPPINMKESWFPSQILF